MLYLFSLLNVEFPCHSYNNFFSSSDKRAIAFYSFSHTHNTQFSKNCPKITKCWNCITHTRECMSESQLSFYYKVHSFRFAFDQFFLVQWKRQDLVFDVCFCFGPYITCARHIHPSMCVRMNCYNCSVCYWIDRLAQKEVRFGCRL